MTSTLLRAQNTTLLSKVRRRFFQILWPSQKTQTLPSKLTRKTHVQRTLFVKDPALNKSEHFIVYKILLPMIRLCWSLAIWLFLIVFGPIVQHAFSKLRPAFLLWSVVVGWRGKNISRQFCSTRASQKSYLCSSRGQHGKSVAKITVHVA